jgi:hypothetical protein
VKANGEGSPAECGILRLNLIYLCVQTAHDVKYMAFDFSGAPPQVKISKYRILELKIANCHVKLAIKEITWKLKKQ